MFHHTLLGFTGIDSPYESPKNPEVVVKTADMSVKECMMEVIDHLKEKGIVPSSATEQVNELFVDPANLPAAKTEAASLPKLNITKVSFAIPTYGGRVFILMTSYFSSTFNGCKCCPKDGLPLLVDS